MNTLKLNKMLMVVAILAISALAGCSSGPSEIDVTMDTYSIELSSPTVKAGEVTFHITNVAADQLHEFVIFKTDLPEDQLPLNADGNVDEEGAGVTHIDEVEDVDMNGGVKDLVVTLEPGRYVLLCNLAENNHYAHGMHVVFTVEK